ncbi:MAG: Carbamoyltransferase [Candidatus Thorarchaeota archaeon]|nr:MAG: Carbamoyltransferase [Candidatus Thorarchaeota archaeon]
MKQLEIHITGIVQGVGFRPFVYRTAKIFNLRGFVLNLGDAGVKVVVQGKEEDIHRFVTEIKNNPPSISRIESLETKWSSVSQEYRDFKIKKSTETKSVMAIPEIPPDIAICDECIEELKEPDSRWHEYPFTSCAACGPRYSTIIDLPYDRPNTTMKEFPLCDTCNTGYTNPMNRRYHAQTTACEKCGPRYTLLSTSRKEKHTTDVIEKTMKLLKRGKIIATQGISGTHLVTITSRPEPIRELRERKRRFQRPFAIMIRDIETLKQICKVTKYEENLMSSWRRPIVLVEMKVRKIGSEIQVIDVIPKESIDLIAPGLDTIGVMLPYSPLHHLMFTKSNESAFVMTSANPTSIPMYVEPNTIQIKLRGIADYVLVHDRRIHQRVDDSVLKFVTNNNPVFIRRARGFVPEPIILSEKWKEYKLLAVGPEEKATGSILKAGAIFTTQYIGDTDKLESLDFLNKSLHHLMYIMGVHDVQGIACDLHPEFMSTEYAREYSTVHDIPLYRVQHHHAHLASMIVDHEFPIDTTITCITADGYGFGSDGGAWGGEILVGGLKEFERYGNLEPMIYPGGDLSAQFAIRPVLGLLNGILDPEQILEIVEKSKVAPNQETTESVLQLLQQTIEKGINSIFSSSVGRYLDAVSAVLGVCTENTYDGECPMKLEAISKETTTRFIPRMKSQGKILDVKNMILDIVNLAKQGEPTSELAFAAQWAIGEGLARIAIKAAEEYDTEYIGFSGGVALNRIITSAIMNTVNSGGYKSLIHRKVPPGDGGISIGQIAVAAARHTCP